MRLLQVFIALATMLVCYRVSGQQGLLGEYYNGTNFETKVLSRVDPAINFNWALGEKPAPGVNASFFSARWTGRLLTPKSGKYVFSAKVDDGIRVWVGGKKVMDAWALHDSENFSGAIVLQANQWYDLKVEYFNDINEGEIQLLWTIPGEGNALLDLFSSSAKPVEGKYFSQPATVKPAVATPKPEKKPVKKTNPTPQTPPAKRKQTPSAASKPAVENPKPPAASPEEMKAKQRALELKYIYFEQSKDIILPDSRATLDDWVVFLQQKPQATIDIAGHTDDLGNAAKNQLLSEQRAQIVADYLIAQGLPQSRIRTKGYGGTKPIYVNPATERERALNRRVEIRAK